jgi:hypothetical protein
MERLRRVWYVGVLLIGSLALGVSAVAADVNTLRLGSGPASEAARFLVGDGLLSLASAVALAGLLRARAWAPAAMLGWMVVLLVVLGWVFFVTVGSSGPPILYRLALWFGSALLSAGSVQRVRRVWGEGRHAASS